MKKANSINISSDKEKIFLSLLTSGLLLIAFYWLPLVVFISFVPLFFACLSLQFGEKSPCLRRASVFKYGFIAGFVFSGGLLYWILVLDAPVRAWLWMGVLLLLVYFGLVFAVSLWVMSFSRRGNVFVIPIVWTSIEFLRSLTFEIGFPWGTIGYAITPYISIIQLAEFTGVAGLSFFILLTNSLIFYAIQKRSWKYIYAVIIIIGLVWLQGKITLKFLHYSPQLRVAIIQPNILPEIKQNGEFEYRKEILYKLSKLAGKCDLLVWPESAVPGYFNLKGSIREETEKAIDSLNIPVILGSGRIATPYVYNSCFFVVPKRGIQGYYDKIYLVPFGERLPFDDIITALGKLNFGQGNFSPGKNYKVFKLNEKAKFSTLICFESIFPRISRRCVRDGANFIVNITDDCWFGKTAGPYQHAQFAMLRAIEYRVPVVRCGNTGISYFATPKGELKYKTDLFTQRVIIDDIPLRTKLTVYAKCGDWFAWICVILLLFLAIKKLWYAKKYKHS